jgi:peptidoglycan/xylan/chitin deacetylase (PgdA/CDA1 family)
MKAACLLYHDIVDGADWNSSGFSGPGTAKYKLSRTNFEAHLAALAKARTMPAITAQELTAVHREAFPFLLTFDDGGVSAFTQIAGILEKYKWPGHFFVTANQIGRQGFLDAEQIRSLRRRGHVIGSHSFSHPTRMSHCSRQELTEEWTRSIEIISEILDERVDTASVPGGYYSRKVAETATAAGIRVLFNSEPITSIQFVDGCMVVGRYNVFQGMHTDLSAQLVSEGSSARTRQWFFWNFKKIAKTIAGRPYLATRQWLLRKD